MSKRIFGTLKDGREVAAYTLKNNNGMTLEVMPYGCRILKLLTKDKDGKPGDVILGHKTLEEYEKGGFQGSFIGRYGNRIGKACFELNGVKYSLPKNDGENSLHGGPGGFHQILWNVADAVEDGDEPYIVFAHTSPDGDEGFPGKLDVTVRYTLTADNALRLEYSAETDKETIFNPTQHSYFNLSGDFKKDVLDTVLQLNAPETTVISEDLIPTGEIASVIGTGLDFTKAKELGRDMFSEEETIKMCNGFDHNLCIEGEGLRKFGEAYEPDSGRVMEVYSSLPGVQLYTFNSVTGGKNKDGKAMEPHTAFCLETQYYPDSPNHSNFPFSTVKPGEGFKCTTEYRFSVK